MIPAAAVPAQQAAVTYESAMFRLKKVVYKNRIRQVAAFYQSHKASAACTCCDGDVWQHAACAAIQAPSSTAVLSCITRAPAKSCSMLYLQAQGVPV
jgi:hypothetical protein